MSKKHKARMAAKRATVVRRPSVSNVDSAFQKCIGRTIVDVEVGQTGKFVTRMLIFEDDSRLVLHSNGTFGWQGQPFTAAGAEADALREPKNAEEDSSRVDR